MLKNVLEGLTIEALYYIYDIANKIIINKLPKDEVNITMDFYGWGQQSDCGYSITCNYDSCMSTKSMFSKYRITKKLKVKFYSRSIDPNKIIKLIPDIMFKRQVLGIKQ